MFTNVLALVLGNFPSWCSTKIQKYFTEQSLTCILLSKASVCFEIWVKNSVW